ncbi:MAG: Eco57I restriction-modification methylase domain-containing protein [Candidatus Bathyarchaeia archaeon]
MAKPTEMTIRDLLQEELRKRGVTVIPEFSVSTPVGRLAPDMLLKNGAEYVVETKLGAEPKLLDAMVRLYDYSKYVTEAKGAFAVLFPEELRRPWSHEVILNIALNPKTEYVVTAIFKDLRPSQRFVGNLAEIADWMAGHVLRAPVVEADTGFAIRVLRDAVDYVTASVRMLQGRELEDIFGGKSVFENVLQYEEGRYPLEEMRRAVTYLLVNQLLFYHVLTRVDASFAVIDEDRIKRPSDLRAYFEPVLRRDFSSVFGFDVASRLPDSAVETVRKVVMVVKALAPEKIRHDLLGKVFHELIPFEVRKAVAAFYTNNEAAEILAQLAIDRADAKVMDLACGSGTLLVAAYRRKRELLQREKGGFTLEDHKRFLEQDLTGVDIMPFAAHMAVVHLSLQALAAGHETEKVRIAVWDSTELEPGQTIPAISRELKAAYKRPTLELFMEGKPLKEEAYVEKGAVTLEGIGGEQIPLEQADLVIMNPPFTRAERLPEIYKEQLKSRLKEYENLIYGRVGLHIFFVLLADKFTKTDGRIAFVLPATVLRIVSMKGARKLWVDNYHIEYIITTWERAAFSEAAQFREILLVAKKLKSHKESGKISNSLKCGIVVLKKLPKNTEDARRIADIIQNKKLEMAVGDTYEDEGMLLSVINQGELKESVDNLFPLISVSDLHLIKLLNQFTQKAKNKLVNCNSYFNENRIEAYEDVYIPPFNSTFIVKKNRAIKKYDVWVVKEEKPDTVISEHRFLQKSLTIPIFVLERGFRRPAGCDILDISDDLDYILVDKFSDANQLFPNEEQAKKALTDISRWKKIVFLKKANLIISRRFDLSAKGTKFLAFFSATPIFGVDMWSIKGFNDKDAKIFTLWFNSTLNLLQLLIYRTETRGAWIKLHEYQIRNSMMLNPKTLTQQEKYALLDLFEKFKTQKFPSILEQLRGRFWARVEIDKAILKILGFNETETNQLLDYLYPALTKEIEQLKALMQG